MINKLWNAVQGFARSTGRVGFNCSAPTNVLQVYVAAVAAAASDGAIALLRLDGEVWCIDFHCSDAMAYKTVSGSVMLKDAFIAKLLLPIAYSYSSPVNNSGIVTLVLTKHYSSFSDVELPPTKSPEEAV